MIAVHVKICGVTGRRDAETAVAAGADMVGLVFVPGTPRAVEPDAVAWVRELDGVATVGVFRDASLEYVMAVRERLGLGWVQLHGNEPDDWLERLGPRVLRRVPTRAGRVDWQRVDWLGRRCRPLIDPGAGDGTTADWQALAAGRSDRPFGLAGGLGPGNVARAIETLGPALVDVSSGVEAAPGRKDPQLVAAFIKAAREAAGHWSGTRIE